MSDSIEEMSSCIEPWLVRRDELRQRAVVWLKSPDFQRTYYDDAHPPFAAKIFFGQNEKKAEAARLWKKCQAFGIQTPALMARYQDLAENGQLVFGCVVIVNPMVLVEPHRSLPCLVAIPQDQGVFPVASMVSTASLLGDIYSGKEQRYPDLRKLLSDDEFQLFRRRPMVRGEISNVEFQIFDVLLRQSWLPPHGMPFVPMLIHPEGKGAVVQIPWKVATGTASAVDSSMPRGTWGEWADLDRAADEAVTRHNARRPGLGSRMMSRIRWKLGLVMVLGLIGLIYDAFTDAKHAPAPIIRKQETETRVVWEQPPEIRRKISMVSAAEYEPLRVKGKDQHGFLILVPPGLFVAATSREPARAFDQAPGALSGPEDLTIHLDTANVRDQSKTRIQLVTGVSAGTVALDFLPDAELQPGDELWVVFGKNRFIRGKLESMNAHRINKHPIKLKLRIGAEEKVDSPGGLPVIQAKTGRAVGILLAEDRPQDREVLLFETISMIPFRGNSAP